MSRTGQRRPGRGREGDHSDPLRTAESRRKDQRTNKTKTILILFPTGFVAAVPTQCGWASWSRRARGLCSLPISLTRPWEWQPRSPALSAGSGRCRSMSPISKRSMTISTSSVECSLPVGAVSAEVGSAEDASGVRQVRYRLITDIKLLPSMR